MSKYNGSERHLANLKAAAEIGRIKRPCSYCNVEYTAGGMVNHQKGCMHNPVNVKHCKQCDIQIYVKDNNFCSRSCGATFNNARKPPVSEETKNKLRQYMTGRKRPFTGIKKPKPLVARECPICSSKFQAPPWRPKRFCSPRCVKINSSETAHKWGKCMSIPYYCIAMGKDVKLQSSWEVKVAEKLDELNIQWVRPEPIDWIDSTGKNRLYFPDFYLPDRDLYLDPKNARVLARDREKMEAVSTKINLVVGELNIIFASLE